jgi:hypothetical protein
MIEVAAALSVANAAFNAIKAGVDRGKELHEMAGTLSKFFDANETINEARIKNQETSATVKFIAGKSVEEEAMELALRKREMDMKYKALRELFIYSGNGETFREFERQRRVIRQRRYEAARAAAKRQSDMIDLIIIVVGIAIATGGLVLMASFVNAANAAQNFYL